MAPPNDHPGVWTKAKVVFDEVADLPQDRRHQRLAELKLDDAVRMAVDVLLKSLEESDGFLEDAEPEETESKHDQHATVSIPGYEVVREIGRGAMGTVYEAVQLGPRRSVALKVLHPSLTSDRMIRRFEREAELLANLNHRSIAQVFDAGVYQDDDRVHVYTALELVRGARSITSHVTESSIGVHDRVAMMIEVCEAVHAAHARGIIHRDIKPGNVLVDNVDHNPKVIDFGVARATSPELSAATLDTSGQEIVGSLGYMSPEQCLGHTDTLDVRSDVFSLGVVLYEVLVGELPYEIESTSLAALPKAITEQIPRSLQPGHDRELDAIVRKALEKDPDHRYDSARAFADDLRRYISGEAVEALSNRRLYVIRRTLRRHASTVAVSLGFVLLIITAAIALGVLYVESRTDAENLRRQAYVQSIVIAQQELESANASESRRLLSEAPLDLRGWEWWHLSARSDDAAWTISTPVVVAGEVSPDGSQIAIGSGEQSIQVWDTITHDLVAEYEIMPHFVESLSYSADGRYLAVATRASQPSYVLDMSNGSVVTRFEPHQDIKAVEFLGDSYQLAVGSASGKVSVYSVPSGEIEFDLGLEGSWCTALSATSDGQTLLAGRNDGTIELWNIEGRVLTKRIERAHEGRVSGIEMSSKHGRIYSASWDGTLCAWDLSLNPVAVRRIMYGPVRGIDLDDQRGQVAVTTSSFIEIRDVSSGLLLHRLNGVSVGRGVGFVQSANQQADLVSWSGGAIKGWSFGGSNAVRIIDSAAEEGHAVAASIDGEYWAIARQGGLVSIRRSSDAKFVSERRLDAGRAYRLAYSPSGQRLAAACDDGGTRVWTVESDQIDIKVQTGERVIDVDWISEDVFITADWSGELAAWSVADGEAIWRIDTQQSGLDSIAVRPGGQWIASGGRDGSVQIYNHKHNAISLTTEFAAHQRSVGALAWTPDGRFLASGGNDNMIYLWDAGSGERIQSMAGHSGIIKSLSFNPTTTRLASAAFDSEVRIWDPIAGDCLLRLRGHTDSVMGAAFADDGRQLMSVSTDGSVRVWYGNRGAN